jgi:hypothetical protein
MSFVFDFKNCAIKPCHKNDCNVRLLATALIQGGSNMTGTVCV